MTYITPKQFYTQPQLKQYLVKFSSTQGKSRLDFLFNLPMFGVVAEIGVANGNFSRCIYEINRPKRLYLIDCWKHQNLPEYRDDCSNIAQSGQNANYLKVKRIFHNNSSVKIHRAFSLDAVRTFPDGYFDWIYLDANHSYRAVKKDLAAWERRVKVGGIIAGDDYTHKPQLQFGVIKAVDELCNSHGWELFLIDDDPYHSYAIRDARQPKAFRDKLRLKIIKIKKKLIQAGLL